MGQKEKGLRMRPPPRDAMTLCGFLSGGKKNRGKEETGLRIWLPAEGSHDAMQLSAGREEELWQRRNRACEYGHPPRGKFSLKPGVCVVSGFFFLL